MSGKDTYKQPKKGKGVDIGIQVCDHDRDTIKFELPGWALWVLSGFLGLVICAVGSYIIVFLYGSQWHFPDDMMDDISLQGAITFRQHDRNGDGYLSLEEFQPLAYRIKDVNETFVYNDTIDDTDEVLTLQTSFQPLQISSMTKDTESLFAGNIDSLSGLKSWQSPNIPWKNFGASDFTPFLPQDIYAVPLCEPYSLIPSTDMRGAQLSSNRYTPPQLVTDGEIIIHRLLSMFHPRPFVYSRFAPQGSVACVRAFNEELLDIVFRIHAEFQLNDPPLYPYWFTPAQFTGHLIMNKHSKQVIDFHFFVPSDKRLNVDMEWLNGPKEKDNMEVDIGYMPQMELRATAPSQPVYQEGKDMREVYIQTSDVQTNIPNMMWDQEVSYDEAARKLEVQLYPFKEVEYYNFTDVWPVAHEKQKPVHSILLWGALDDQSC